MDLDSLYQEIILDHYKNPHHKGLRDPYEAEVHHVNPTCGDEVTLRVHVSDGVVQDVSYDALGCSISQASASVMTDLVIGKPIGKLSKGFRQRFGMAQVLLHEPDVLILDEPTTGLDPNQIRDVRRTIRELGRDKAVLLSTHILQEVEAVCDRVVFVNEGKVVFQGSVAELKASAPNLDDAFARHTASWNMGVSA